MRRSATDSIRRRAVAVFALAVLTGARPALAQNQNQFEMTDQQFNSWITNDGTSPQQFFQTQLEGRLARLDLTCDLTASQREKLQLAGRGDWIRFEGQMAPLRDELVGKLFDQNNLSDVHQRVQPLAQRLRKGILDEGSLFSKVMTTTLDDEQRLAYESAVAEQIRYQYRAKVKLFVATLEKSAPMLDQQRRDLLALLLKTTRPPKRWGRQYDWYYVLWQASQVPRDNINLILDGPQLQCFEQAVRQGAQYGVMLEREGMVPEDNPSPAADNPPDEVADPFDVPVLEIGP
jgi:hypothetical protein